MKPFPGYTNIKTKTEMVRLFPMLFIAITLLLNSSFTAPSKGFDRYISVTLKSIHPISNNGVGNDWENHLSVNNKVITEGQSQVFRLNKRAPLSIQAYAKEDDKEYPDIGVETLLLSYSDLVQIETHLFHMRITVQENGGRSSGKIAEWKYIIEISKVKKPKENN